MSARSIRSGMSLPEMAAIISISGLILGGSMPVLRHLQHLAQADTARGVRAELACDQLRRDLVHAKVEIIPDGLQITTGEQKFRWQMEDGHLERNGRQMLAADRFTTESDARRLTILIAPVGLPTRRIETSL